MLFDNLLKMLTDKKIFLIGREVKHLPGSGSEELDRITVGNTEYVKYYLGKNYDHRDISIEINIGLGEIDFYPIKNSLVDCNFLEEKNFNKEDCYTEKEDVSISISVKELNFDYDFPKGQYYICTEPEKAQEILEKYTFQLEEEIKNKMSIYE